MKKKLVPVLVALAFIAVAVVAFYMGQQSATPAVDDLPAQSSTPESNEGKSPATDAERETVEYLQGDELTALFQQVYDLVIEQEIPQEYRLQTELLYLPDMNATGKELPTDYEEQYLTWRLVHEVAEPETSAPAESEAPVEPEVQETPNQKPVTQQPSNQSTPSGNGNTSSNNQGNSSNSGSNSSVDANGDGWPDDWVLEDPGNGSGSSDHTDEERDPSKTGGSDTEGIDYSGITIG